MANNQLLDTDVLDNYDLSFGTDRDIRCRYDETTDDRLEWHDGTNVLAYLSDLGTTGLFGVTGRIECPQIGISADTDLMALASNQLTINGAVIASSVTVNGSNPVMLHGQTAATNLNWDFDATSANPTSKNIRFFRSSPSPSGICQLALNSPNSLTENIVLDAKAGRVKAKQGSADDLVIMPGVVYKNYTAVGNVGSGEDDLMSHAIAAATLGTDGQDLVFEMVFKTAANANNKTIKVKYGGTTLWDSTAIAANDQRVKVRGRITRTGATTQIAEVSVHASGGYTNTVVTSAPAETLANAITLKATGEATSDNDIQQLSMTLMWEPVNT